MNIRLILALLFLAIISTFIFFGNKAAHDNYSTSEINGTIDKISEYKGYITISVNGDEFNIKSNANPLNGSDRFYNIAEISDSIYKPANSDTLKLIHQGKSYLYEAY
jgi:hypothetical protein